MIEEIFQDVREQMGKAIDALRRHLATIRTGRASITMLDGIRIEYYGNATPLNQLATISVPEPRLLMIKPWEQNLIQEIEKIRKKLGIKKSEYLRMALTNLIKYLLIKLFGFGFYFLQTNNIWIYKS